MMIIGIPNVGKSSLINILRNRNLKIKGRASPVANTPGVTRAVMTKIRVSNDPPIFLIDTPGIMAPSLRDMDMGLKLALAGTLVDHNVGIVMMTDYLLYHLNKTLNLDYVERFGLEGPTDNVTHLLKVIAERNGWQRKVKDATTGTLKTFPDFQVAATHAVKVFREGQLGLINLDEEAIAEARERLHDPNSVTPNVRR